MSKNQKDYFDLTVADFEEAVKDFVDGPCSEYSYDASTSKIDTIDGEFDGYQAEVIFTAEPYYHQKYTIELHSTGEGVQICCGDECYLDCDSAGLWTYLFHEAAKTVDQQDNKIKLLDKAARYTRAESKLRHWLLKQLIADSDFMTGTVYLKIIHLDVAAHANVIRDKAAAFYADATL
ncbi:MAG: hypothetical protein JEY79_10980 [Pseudodesulfovibrio sp.]|nr:hypothetical protein [Pseudodesulfovibrio sp.]